MGVELSSDGGGTGYMKREGCVKMRSANWILLLWGGGVPEGGGGSEL